MPPRASSAHAMATWPDGRYRRPARPGAHRRVQHGRPRGWRRDPDPDPRRPRRRRRPHHRADLPRPPVLRRGRLDRQRPRRPRRADRRPAGHVGGPVQQRRHGRVHGRRRSTTPTTCGPTRSSGRASSTRARSSSCSPARRSPAAAPRARETGPFYCPADQKVYLDTDFFKELSDRFGAPGDFAQAYVIAHEIGHHVQKLTGIEAQVRQLQQQDPSRQNELSVKMELQADCLAGVWAQSVYQQGDLEPGDIEEGLRRRVRGRRRPDPGRAPASASTRRPGPTAPRSSGRSGSTRASSPAIRRAATPSAADRPAPLPARRGAIDGHSVECPRAGSSTAEQMTLNH